MNRKNELVHMWVGSYVLSAFTTGLSQVMQPILCKGKRSKEKYVEEPIQLFPKTEEEIAEEKENATQAFIAWANNFEKDVKNKFKD